MTMPICVLVLGLPRSGTSCAAGVLHHLGVFMGERLMQPSKINKKGFFHDLDFEVAFHTGGVDELIYKRQSRGTPWGVNTRRWQELRAFSAVEPKVLLTSRSMAEVKASNELAFKSSDHIERTSANLLRAVAEFNRPTLVVEYDRMIKMTSLVVRGIAEFVGLPVTQAAIDFVDPAMRNFSVD